MEIRAVRLKVPSEHPEPAGLLIGGTVIGAEPLRLGLRIAASAVDHGLLQ